MVISSIACGPADALTRAFIDDERVGLHVERYEQLLNTEVRKLHSISSLAWGRLSQLAGTSISLIKHKILMSMFIARAQHHFKALRCLPPFHISKNYSTHQRFIGFVSLHVIERPSMTGAQRRFVVR